MQSIHTYIKEAREKYGADDAAIREQLLAAGWKKTEVAAALKARSLPPAPHPSDEAERSSTDNERLSSLAQAMHHILLWFFTASTAITLSIVSAALFGGEASTDALAAYVAVGLVTLTPYGLLYVDYLRKFRRNARMTTGRIWSIITIVVHTVGAIAALITLIINLIVGPSASVVIASSVLAGLNLLVLTTYFTATFVRPERVRFRRAVLLMFLPVVSAILIVFGILALSKMGPIRADEHLRERLVKTTAAIREYRVTHDEQLPESLNQISYAETDGITYNRLGSKRYELCASFNSTGSTFSFPAGGTFEQDDGYVTEYTFRVQGTGNQCFRFNIDPYRGFSPASE